MGSGVIFRGQRIRAAVVAAAILAAGAGIAPRTLDAQGATGTIAGRIRLTGPAPANTLIRMGGDPRCSRAAGGRRITQDVVLKSADGGLANVFVSLQGSFKAAPSPQPVTIDQKGCVFVPRVVGAQVGQTLQISNSDATGHNVHSLSEKGNVFNVSQPKQGMVNRFQLKSDELVMRIRCDIHSWMISYVGIVPHPYFSVSAMDGAFTIQRVPAGRHTIQTWHEAYGRLTKTVDVKPGQTVTVDFGYTGKEKPSAAALQDLTLPADVHAARFQLEIATR
jgi:plastocyanin